MECTRKNLLSQTSYTITDAILSKVSEYKYLGVYLSSDLNWQRHVDYVTGKAGKALGFLRRNAKNFIMPTKKLLYKTYVRSVLDYSVSFGTPQQFVTQKNLKECRTSPPNLFVNVVTESSVIRSRKNYCNEIHWIVEDADFA